MKKVIAILLTLAMAVCVFAACGTTNTATDTNATSSNATDTSLDDVKAAGKLVIATSPDFPPYESLDADNNVEGIEIDIMNLVAEKLGVTLEVQQVSFDSVIPGVQADKFDAGVSGITVTEERQEMVLFTDPYCVESQAIVVAEGSDITSKADLEGKTVSVQLGTTADTYCSAAGYTVQQYEANADAQQALLNGKVDAWVIDHATAVSMVEDWNGQAGSAKLTILDEAMTEEPYAFAFNLADGALVAEINTILNGLTEDGTIKTIFEKWGQDYVAPTAE